MNVAPKLCGGSRRIQRHSLRDKLLLMMFQVFSAILPRIMRFHSVHFGLKHLNHSISPLNFQERRAFEAAAELASIAMDE